MQEALQLLARCQFHILWGGLLVTYNLAGAVYFLIPALPVSPCLRSCFEYRTSFILSSSKIFFGLWKQFTLTVKMCQVQNDIKMQKPKIPTYTQYRLAITILSCFFPFDFLYIFDIYIVYVIFQHFSIFSMFNFQYCILFSSSDTIS